MQSGFSEKYLWKSTDKYQEHPCLSEVLEDAQNTVSLPKFRRQEPNLPKFPKPFSSTYQAGLHPFFYYQIFRNLSFLKTSKEKNKSSLLILNKTRKYTVCLNIKYQVNHLNIQGSHSIITLSSTKEQQLISQQTLNKVLFTIKPAGQEVCGNPPSYFSLAYPILLGTFPSKVGVHLHESFSKHLSYMGTLFTAQLNYAPCSVVWKEGLEPTFGSWLFILLVECDCKQSHPSSWRWRREGM